jgi:hypothetical protein
VIILRGRRSRKCLYGSCGWGVGGKAAKFSSSTVRSQQIMPKTEKNKKYHMSMISGVKSWIIEQKSWKCSALREGNQSLCMVEKRG